jgi:hypothetical protein
MSAALSIASYFINNTLNGDRFLTAGETPPLTAPSGATISITSCNIVFFTLVAIRIVLWV